ncbi:MAG: precorrin-8X methylmutase, partial [Candidatus Omnitrophota bacterium]|nr:precorrin-8X methylmutase [Candidatus Omnitrophota bacterium]
MEIITDPKDIETKSFQIVNKYLRNVKLPRFQKEVAKRVLHATSDLNYAKDLLFSKGAIPGGLKAIRQGKNIIVDAQMVKAGINKTILNCFGGEVVCLINNKDVIRKSAELKITRAILAMRKSAKLIDKAIV